MIELIESVFDGLKLFKPRVFPDNRGYFLETYNSRDFAAFGLPENFAQDNLSSSRLGTIRGLHYQLPPHEQGKLVWVIYGRVKDVAVDIRRGSPTFGKHYSIELSSENHYIFWIPAGFAHGFVTLEENTMFAYKCTQYYQPQAERGIRWDDPDLGIDWGMQNPIISSKDVTFPCLSEVTALF